LKPTKKKVVLLVDQSLMDAKAMAIIFTLFLAILVATAGL
jgi:hypothetical protein